MNETNSSIPGFILLGVLVWAYFAPAVVAYFRKTKNIGAVIVINVFLGWTLIGWVAALAMAVSGERTVRNPNVVPRRPDGEQWPVYGKANTRRAHR